MWPARSIFRLLLAAACVVVSIAALINVFADNADLVARAKELGCPKGACDLARVDRTPFAQTFDLRTPGGLVTVRCARVAVFFGEYGCVRR
jgi:hypothetical protein